MAAILYAGPNVQTISEAVTKSNKILEEIHKVACDKAIEKDRAKK